MEATAARRAAGLLGISTRIVGLDAPLDPVGDAADPRMPGQGAIRWHEGLEDGVRCKLVSGLEGQRVTHGNRHDHVVWSHGNLAHWWWRRWRGGAFAAEQRRDISIGHGQSSRAVAIG